MVTQNTARQSLNILAGYSDITTGLSEQGVINKYKTEHITSKTPQNWGNQIQSSSSKIDLSFQEYLYIKLKAALPTIITDVKTAYSEQDLLNIAIDNSVTMATLFP